MSAAQPQTQLHLRPFYRRYDLPWTDSEHQESRFRRIMLITLLIALIIGLLVPWLPAPKRVSHQVEDVPPRLAKLMVEQRKPPPPPPPPPKEQPKPETPKEPRPEPKPEQRQQQAREKASVAGLLPFKDDLAELRDNRMVDLATAKRPLTDASRAGDMADRSMITSKAGQGSGGIKTSSLSRGFGGGGGGNLTGRNTTQVSSGLANPDARATRSGAGGKAARSREEIELVFDRNKGAIYNLYNRAARENPALQGKVVLELTITPSGEVTQCRVVSSELKDPELERKLVARIKMFRFEAKDVETMITTKPIDFFPS